MDSEDLQSLQDMAREKHNLVHRPNQKFANYPNVKSTIECFDALYGKITSSKELTTELEEEMKELVQMAENVQIALEGAKFDDEDLVMLDKQAHKMVQDLHHMVEQSHFHGEQLSKLMREFDAMFDRFKKTELTKNLERTKDDFHELNLLKGKTTQMLKEMQKQDDLSKKGKGMSEKISSPHESTAAGAGASEETKVEDSPVTTRRVPFGRGALQARHPVRHGHEVQRGHPPVRQHRAVGRAQHHEGRGLDRWLLPLHLPADVDLQAGVRRVRHHTPQVLLRVFPRSLRLAFAVKALCLFRSNQITSRTVWAVESVLRPSTQKTTPSTTERPRLEDAFLCAVRAPPRRPFRPCHGQTIGWGRAILSRAPARRAGVCCGLQRPRAAWS
ncbi:hypothetical protein BASA82_000487 [Batrachochytrium salamandrivorans]|nr:hypothetical protein BASA82_000487 [Batrachochytrium salamandrivorans]